MDRCLGTLFVREELAQWIAHLGDGAGGELDEGKRLLRALTEPAGGKGSWAIPADVSGPSGWASS